LHLIGRDDADLSARDYHALALTSRHCRRSVAGCAAFSAATDAGSTSAGASEIVGLVEPSAAAAALGVSSATGVSTLAAGSTASSSFSF